MFGPSRDSGDTSDLSLAHLMNDMTGRSYSLSLNGQMDPVAELNWTLLDFGRRRSAAEIAHSQFYRHQLQFQSRNPGGSLRDRNRILCIGRSELRRARIALPSNKAAAFQPISWGENNTA
jgi:hypothetical protein